MDTAHSFFSFHCFLICRDCIKSCLKHCQNYKRLNDSVCCQSKPYSRKIVEKLFFLCLMNILRESCRTLVLQNQQLAKNRKRMYNGLNMILLMFSKLKYRNICFFMFAFALLNLYWVTGQNDLVSMRQTNSIWFIFVYHWYVRYNFRLFGQRPVDCFLASRSKCFQKWTKFCCPNISILIDFR